MESLFRRFHIVVFMVEELIVGSSSKSIKHLAEEFMFEFSSCRIRIGVLMKNNVCLNPEKHDGNYSCAA